MHLADPSPHDLQVRERAVEGWSGRWYGVFQAQVIDIRDNTNQGRVQVTLPWSPDPKGRRYEAWARLATLFAGNDRGSWFMPDVGDEVLIAFEQGDPRRPFVIGGLWNGKDKPPQQMDGAGRNLKKVLRSRNGVTITFDDEDGQEKLSIETPGGQRLTLRDGPATIEATDSSGNSVKLDPSGITVTAAAMVTVNAPQVKISAGIVSVDAGMSKFSGVVQADTVISNSVISASYTPGAGNIW